MFSSLLSKLGINREQAPSFHYYLERHIHLDGDEHGPMALRLVNAMCKDDDSVLLHQALASAEEALLSRRRLWDQVLERV